VSAKEPAFGSALRAFSGYPSFGVVQRFVLHDLDQVPVVEARAAHCVLVDTEAELSDQMQGAQRSRTKPRDIAGIGRYFRLYQDDVERTRDSARA